MGSESHGCELVIELAAPATYIPIKQAELSDEMVEKLQYVGDPLRTIGKELTDLPCMSIQVAEVLLIVFTIFLTASK